MPETISTATVEFSRITDARKRLKEADFVLDFLEKSNAHRRPFLELAERIMENRLVTFDLGRERGAIPHIGSPQIATSGALLNATGGRRNRSKLKHPKTSQIIDDLTSQAVGLLTSTPEFIEVMPIGGQGDAAKAKYLGRLMGAYFQSPGVSRTIHEIIAESFTLGVVVVELGWETRSRMQTVMRPIIDPDLGVEIGRETGAEEVIYRDGPMFRMVDLWDSYWDPAGNRIQENMSGFAKRFRMTKHEALRMARAGVFDMGQVQMAIRGAGGLPPRSEVDAERWPQLTLDTVEDYGMLNGFEWWGEVPFDSKGGRNRVITLLNGIHVRSHINPFIDGNIPFKEIVVNPVPGRFMGLSPAEVIRYLQDSADSLLMTYTDASDFAARNVLLLGRGSGADPERIAERRPGDVIPVGNPDMVVPIPVDTNSLTFAAGELQRREVQMAEASGANNPLEALRDIGKRSAATTSSAIVQLASQKTETMVRLIERNDLPFIGRMLHSRMRQFLDPRREQIIVGEQFPVKLSDVDFDADVRFIGSRTAMSKQQKIATTREAVNLVGTNPAIFFFAPKLMLKYLKDDLSIPEAAEIVEEGRQAFIKQQEFQAAQQQQQASGSGSVPAASSGAEFNTDAGETENQGGIIQ